MNETQKQKITSREQEIIFTNFTEEDFEGRWNKRIYRIKAGKSVYLPFFLAETFGKHLVDGELNKLAGVEIKKIREIDPRIDQKEVERREMAILTNAVLRQKLMDKCIEITAPSSLDHIVPKEVQVREVPLKTQLRSAELVESGRISPSDLGAFNQPKKAVDDEEFEGLEKTE